MTAETPATPVSPGLRYSRQAGLLPPERLGQMAAIVIGTGAIGRQVALGLGAAGIGALHLYDFDTVGEENLANQGFSSADLGKPKVEAVAAVVRANNPGVNVVTNNRHFNAIGHGDFWDFTDEAFPDSVVVFCCVDSIETREVLWRSLPQAPYFYCDGRMSGETMRILSIWDETTYDAYEDTLFTADEAQPGSCTTRSSWFTATIAAGYMVSQFSKRLRNLYVALSPDIQVNLLSSDIIVAR